MLVVTLLYNEKFGTIPRNLREDFFLKIDIHSAKGYTKNVPNIEVRDFIISII